MDTDHQLLAALDNAGLPHAAAYTTGQVARILGVSAETVRRLVDAYEPEAVRPRGPNAHTHAAGLMAIRIHTHRRIPHDALVDWLRDNAAYLRLYGPGPGPGHA